MNTKSRQQSNNSPRNSVFIKRGGTIVDETFDSPTTLRNKYNKTVGGTHGVSTAAPDSMNSRAMRIIALKK